MTTGKSANASASANSMEQNTDDMFSPGRFDGLSEDEMVPLLQEEIARLTIEQNRAIALEKELRDKEDPANRVSFHKEIFTAQQDKLRLGVEIELRQKKINRIQRGFAEGTGPVSDGVKSGFLF